jgi:hypothetical protein
MRLATIVAILACVMGVSYGAYLPWEKPNGYSRVIAAIKEDNAYEAGRVAILHAKNVRGEHTWE